MSLLSRYIFSVIAASFLAAMLFSCDDDLSKAPKVNIDDLSPSGIGTNIRLVYTDSMEIRAILTSDKYLDFSNQGFSYAEFPDGLQVDFFDKQGNKSVITANYGILYNKTSLVELRGDVHLRTHDQKELKTEQLYWDQGNEWIFTEKRFQFKSPETDMDATRLDISRDFKYFSSDRVFSGEVEVEDQPDS